MAKIKIEARANTDKVEYGTAESRVYSPQETLMKMLKALGMFWGMAAFCVFLPVVHFVLVPLFFFIGIFAAFRARRYHEEILSGEVKCPNCSQEIKIGKTSVTWPHKEICQNCAVEVKIFRID